VVIDGKVLLRRKANLRSGKTRAIGTFFVTSAKLSFQPLAGKRSIDIPISKITDMSIVGKIYKKMSITADGKHYLFYMKEAADVMALINTLKESAANH
jgi:hypothetical protein